MNVAGSRFRTVVRSVVRIGVIAAAAIALRFAVIAPYRANLVLKRVEMRSRAALKEGDAQRAAMVARRNLDALGPYARVCTGNVNYHLISAVNLQILNRTDDALAHYETALRSHQRPELYFDKGLTLLAAGRTEQAIPAFVTAIRFQPGLLDQLEPDIRSEVASRLR